MGNNHSHPYHIPSIPVTGNLPSPPDHIPSLLDTIDTGPVGPIAITTEEEEDTEARDFLKPIEDKLRLLSQTTPEKMPPQHLNLKAKSHQELLHQRMIPIYDFIRQQMQDMTDSERLRMELRLWKHIAYNYWPLSREPGTHLHLHAMYHNALFRRNMLGRALENVENGSNNDRSKCLSALDPDSTPIPKGHGLASAERATPQQHTVVRGLSRLLRDLNELAEAERHASQTLSPPTESSNDSSRPAEPINSNDCNADDEFDNDEEEGGLEVEDPATKPSIPSIWQHSKPGSPKRRRLSPPTDDDCAIASSSDEASEGLTRSEYLPYRDAVDGRSTQGSVPEVNLDRPACPTDELFESRRVYRQARVRKYLGRRQHRG